MNRTILIFLIVAILVGCAAPQRLSTPSGRPEVTISNASKKEVMDFAVNNFVGAGFEIKEVTDYHAVFTRLDQSLSGALLYGSKYDSTPEYRFKLTFAELAGKIRVLCTVSVVTNPGSAFERVKDVTYGKNALDLQRLLMNFKKDMELADSGIIGIHMDNANVITELVSGYSAEEAGIKVGDRIISVGGKPVPDVNDGSISYMIAGDVGTFAEITILREGQEMTFKVERRKRP